MEDRAQSLAPVLTASRAVGLSADQMEKPKRLGPHGNPHGELLHRLPDARQRDGAEDLVQEAYLCWQEAPEADVRSPRAYLATAVTRLAINQRRSAQRRRETYVGSWLRSHLPITIASWALRPASRITGGVILTVPALWSST